MAIGALVLQRLRGLLMSQLWNVHVAEVRAGTAVCSRRALGTDNQDSNAARESEGPRLWLGVREVLLGLLRAPHRQGHQDP